MVSQFPHRRTSLFEAGFNSCIGFLSPRTALIVVAVVTAMIWVEYFFLVGWIGRAIDAIEAEWRPTSNNRNAKFYALTRKGRRAAQAELDGWLRLSGAVARVLRALEQEA